MTNLIPNILFVSLPSFCLPFAHVSCIFTHLLALPDFKTKASPVDTALPPTHQLQGEKLKVNSQNHEFLHKSGYQGYLQLVRAILIIVDQIPMSSACLLAKPPFLLRKSPFSVVKPPCHIFTVFTHLPSPTVESSSWSGSVFFPGIRKNILAPFAMRSIRRQFLGEFPGQSAEMWILSTEMVI